MAQSSIVKNILKKKYKEDNEVKQIHQNDNGNNDMNTNNPAFKDMPMIIFYTQLGARGLDMIKYLKKYDF